ncbi:MAG: YfiR family protein [bacterium]
MNKHISLFLIIFTFNTAGYAQNSKITRATEYGIKAAFVFNFAKFVDWPDEAFVDATQPIVIGVVGRDPFGLNLVQTVRGKTVKGRNLVVKRFTRIEDLDFCNILYISSSEKKRMTRIFKKIKDSSVLTIGETKGFAYEGGMIHLFNMDNKVRFEINVKTAERAGLKISSRLLKLAKIVEDDHTNEN